MRKELQVCPNISHFKYNNDVEMPHIMLLDYIRAHAAELGNEVPSEPLLFLKPTTSYLKEGGKIIVRIFKLYVS